MDLCRVTENKMVAGVCAGLARKFNVEPAIVRIAAVFLTIVSGFVPGIVAYIVAAVIIPEGKQGGQ